jgi:hypothetical protein
MQQANWFESELTQFVENNTSLIPDAQLGAIWDVLSDIEAGLVYQARLRLITAAGEYFSNFVQFEIDEAEENIWLLGKFDLTGNIPNVKLPVALDQIHYELLQQALADENFDRNSLFVWAVDNISAPFDEIRLNVRSNDDPRYFVPVPLIPIVATESGMLFELEDPAPCTRYSGSLEVTGSVDETGHFTYYTTEEASFGLDCLTVTAVVAAPEFGACEVSAESDIRFIELTAESLDGTELVLLTLSHQLPDGSEDLIYSAANHSADKIIRPNWICVISPKDATRLSPASVMAKGNKR